MTLSGLEKTAIVFLVVGFSCGVLSFLGLASNQGAMGIIRKGNSGYWGTVESSVDWCEENYQDHHVVAETHNTVSSFLIVIAGLGIIVSCRRVLAERRYYLLGVWLAVVGFGSVAFHGALLRIMQAADEIPMVWVAAIGSYVTIEHRNVTRQHTLLPFVIFVVLLAVSSINLAFEGPLAVAIFHMSFAPAEVFFFVQTIRLYTTVVNPDTRKVFLQSFVFYAAAMTCWSIDIVFCSHLQNLPYDLPNPQLHAWGWHLFVAYASYGLAIATLQERQETILKVPSRIDYLPLLQIPYLTAAKKQKQS